MSVTLRTYKTMQLLDSFLSPTLDHRPDCDQAHQTTLLGFFATKSEKKSDGEKMAEKVWQETFKEQLPTAKKTEEKSL